MLKRQLASANKGIFKILLQWCSQTFISLCFIQNGNCSSSVSTRMASFMYILLNCTWNAPVNDSLYGWAINPIPYTVVAITNLSFPFTLENTSRTSAFLSAVKTRVYISTSLKGNKLG